MTLLALAAGGEVPRAAAAQPAAPDAPGDPVDVRRYGMKCDGASDDTAAFRAVAAAVAKRPAQVRIPIGECMLRGAVTFTGNAVDIRGSGRGSILVQTDPASDTLVFAAPDPAARSGYQNGIGDLRLTRNADTSAGSGLRLVRQINFKGDNLDVREFFTDLMIEGGSDIQFSNTTFAAGRFWPRDAVKAGSSFVTVAPVAAGSAVESPGEVFFSNFNWRGEVNAQQVDKGLVVNGVDGLWLQNGHIGFDATDFYITPTQDGANIQSVLVSNVYFDGSSFGGTGLHIPPMRAGRNLIEELLFTNSVFANHVTQGAIVAEKAVVGLKFVGNTFRNEKGWCLNVAAVGRVEVNGNTFTRCGGHGAGAGALTVGATTDAGRALVIDNLFDGCTATTTLRAKGLLSQGNSYEAACAR